MITFSNSPTRQCSVCIIVVFVIKPLFVTTSILSLRSTSGKVGEQEITAKEKRLAEEDLKLDYGRVCFTIVVATFSI